MNQLLGLEAPKHPLIMVHDDRDTCFDPKYEGARFTSDLYLIMFKDKVHGTIGYGRNSYDFQEGTLVFVAPGQVITMPSQEILEQSKGWSMSFHPDLIRKSHLGEVMDEYSFFTYEVNEALHLSAEEQAYIFEVVKQIKKEYSQLIDKHSQRLIISNLELLLNYCTRFYDRQFYTRTNFNKDFVSLFERSLKDYFSSNKANLLGLPSVSYFGQELQYVCELLE